MNKTDLKFILMVIVLCLANVSAYREILPQQPEKISTATVFPEKIPGWTAQNVAYDKSILDTLKPDATIYRQFEDYAKIPVTLFLAYYNSAEKSDLSHSPIVCFTGQGWEILSSNHRTIPITSTKRTTIRINRLEQLHGDVRMVTYYWYQSSQQAFSNRGIQKVSLLVHKLMGGNEKNAFIRLTVQGAKESNLEKSEKVMDRFIKDFYPDLRSFLS